MTKTMTKTMKKITTVQPRNRSGTRRLPKRGKVRVRRRTHDGALKMPTQRDDNPEHKSEQHPQSPQQAKRMSDKEMLELARKHSQEETELLKKQGEERRKNDDKGRGDLLSAHAQQRAELDRKHNQERTQKDPRGLMQKRYRGLDWQRSVAALHAELEARAEEVQIEVGPIRTFGLEFDVFDPLTGMLISPARAHRRDIGDEGILQTAEAAITDIVSARRHQALAGAPTHYAADRVNSREAV